MRGWGALALAAALATGCGKSLGDLGEFPCARDGTCPEGYVCAQGTCTPAAACGLAGSCGAGLVCLSGEACVDDQQCHVGKQDCTDASRPKCSVTLSTESEVSLQCVPSQGSVAEGGGCKWSDDVPHVSGRDDCAAGLFCSSAYASVRAPSTSGATCLSLCDRTRACAQGFCARVAEEAGVCTVPCAPGEGCGAGRDCKWAEELGSGTYRGACLRTGTKGAADPRQSACGAPWDCALGYDCWNWGTSAAYCHRLCDPSRPCPSGDACLTDERFPSGQGICGCELFSGQCGAGRSCTVWGDTTNGLYTACSADGSRALGQTCGAGVGSCQSGLECWTTDFSTSYCRNLCDAAHPCPMGTTCKAMKFLFDSAGVCLP